MMIAFNTVPTPFIVSQVSAQGTWELVEGICDATPQIKTYVNGSGGTPLAITGTPASGTTVMQIGTDEGGSALNGDIAELLFFNSALNTTDRQNVESYLNTKWAIY